jgi:hypothetical protein
MFHAAVDGFRKSSTHPTNGYELPRRRSITFWRLREDTS